MGGKNSKREAPYGSTSSRGSPSAKVSRTRSLPSRVFTRRLSYDYGGSFRGKPLVEDAEEIDHIEEFKRLVDLEKLHEKDNAGFCGATKQDIILSCISPLRGSREEIIYEEEEEEEEEDDSLASGNQQQTKVGSSKASPAFSRAARRSRLASQSAPCLARLISEAEGTAATSEDLLVDPVGVVDVSSLGENSEKFVTEVSADIDSTNQEVSIGLVKNCDVRHSEARPAAEFVDSTQNVELLSVDIVANPNSELPCNENGLDLREGQTLLEDSSLTCGDEDRESIGTDCHDTAESCDRILSDIVVREGNDYKFQAQRHCAKPRTWRRLNRTSGCDSRFSEGAENMTGKGKVNLSFNNPGKRHQDTRKISFTDTSDMTWDDSSGKRIKDGVEGEEIPPSDIQPDAFSWGLVGQSDPFLGFDAAGFFGKVPAGGDQINGGYVRRSPSKISKGTALARKVRGLRASPKPVSSLESCLRAQMADPLDRNRGKSVIRPLNFSSAEEGKVEGASMTASTSSRGSLIDESSPKSRQSAGSSGLPRLPNLSKFLKEYAAKLATIRKVESVSDCDTNCVGVQENGLASSSPSDGNRKKTFLPALEKKRKVSDSRRFLPNGSDQGHDGSSSEGSTVASFETLLFSFGVGLGVLFGSGPHKIEVKRLRQLLEEMQTNLEALKLELARRKSPARFNRDDSATGTVSKVQHVLRSHCESEQQEDQMAELEAELEAELDQLTRGESATVESQYSVFDELEMDGVASVVYGDLAPTGLPAKVDEDSEDDSAPAQPACLNNYAVSPRQLTRLLRKLQATRQEELITELEEDLEAANSKLQSREKELELWKDRVKRLTVLALGSASGAENTSQGIAPVGRISTSREEIAELLGVPRYGETGTTAFGNLGEEDPAGLNPHMGAVSQGDVKTSLETESAKQDPKDLGGDGLEGNGLPADDDVSNEFLQSMIEFEDEGSSQAEQAARDCRPILDNAQIITQLIDSVHGLDSYGDRAESVEMGSATPSVDHFSSSVSISDAWDQPIESATPERFRGGGTRGILYPRTKLTVPYPSRRTSCNSDLGNPVLIRNLENEDSPSPTDHCTAIVRYTEAMESSISVSDMSEVENSDPRIADPPYSVKYIDSTMRPASEPAFPADGNPSSRGGVGRAGLTTPVEKARQQLFKTPVSAPVQWPGELSPTVLEKIARWEGLMEGETPGPATGSDWECLSRASESEQMYAGNSEYNDVNVFSEENLVLEAEEMLGRMLIKRIVENSKCGSDSLVKKAQNALATLERDDGIEADLYPGEDAFMNERTDSEADTSERASDSREGWSDDQQTHFLDTAVREEYEFFRRLEIISKDRKAMKSVKEKPTKEMVNAGVVDFESIPELDLGLNSQLSPGSQPSGISDAPSVVAEKQSEDPAKEKYVMQLSEPNTRVRDNWRSRTDARQDAYRGDGYREIEVRSRRRL